MCYDRLLAWGGAIVLIMVSFPLQVRQHTGHKRTFFYLEQLILKYDVDQQCISIKDMHEVRPCMPTLLQCMSHLPYAESGSMHTS